jgi:hypothetical protein
VPTAASPTARLPFAAVALVGATWMLVVWGLWGFSHDDAFITYRYAENFARGRGLVFNPGEPVLGTTAPGWAALLGGLSAITGPLGWKSPQWGTLLSTVALLTPPWMVLMVLRHRGIGSCANLWWLGASLLSILLPWNLELLGGEYFAVFALLMAGGGQVLELGRPGRGGLCLGLAALVRLDCAPALALVGLVEWGRRRRLPWRYGLTVGAVLAAGLLPLIARFGSPIPQTLAGKRSELAEATGSYSQAQWEWLQRTLPEWSGWWLLGLAVIGAAAAVARFSMRTSPGLIALGAFIAWQEAFYRLVGVAFAPWYHVGTVVVMAGMATLGALTLGSLASRRSVPAGGLAALLLAPALLPCSTWLAETWRQPPDPRYPLYRSVGEHLDRETAPGLTATVEIGIIGYFALDHPILDLVGLTSPTALEAKREHSQSRLLADLRPRYVVDTPLFYRNYPALREIAHHPGYRPIARFPDLGSGRGPTRLLQRGATEDPQADPLP